MPKQKQLTTRQYLSAMLNVAKLSFRIAPGSVSFKMVGIVVNAALPNAITFFAAQTITELTAAYNGSEEAGQRAILYVVAAASLGLFSTAWASLDSYIQQLMRFKIEAKVSDIMYEKFLSLDYWRYDDKDTVDTYDRAQKFSQFYAYIFNQLSALITQLTTMLFALIVLFVFMPWMAIIVFLSVIPGLYIQFKI